MLPNAVDYKKSCFLLFAYSTKQAIGQSGPLQLVHIQTPGLILASASDDA